MTEELVVVAENPFSTLPLEDIHQYYRWLVRGYIHPEFHTLKNFR